MNGESSAWSTAEVVDEVSKWGVGLGVLLFALAPFAVPIIVLTVVALLPLLVPLLALGLLAVVVLVPIVLGRALVRWTRGRLGLGKQASVGTSVE
jgi:hypothetical protein